MHVLLRKLPPSRKHFFVCLKTAISSNACGTATLKSPLSRAFSVPHVHPRLRKRLSRCTLDCGFQTAESPALRGFVAERCPTTGTSLYLVLKSNGLCHSKNLPVKFGFSPKIVPANIVQKLPSQRCPQPFLITIFNFSHKWPTFAFVGKSETHSALLKESHTTAHTAKQGAFRVGVVSLPSDRSARSQTSPGRVSERRTLPLLGLGRVCSRRTQKAFGTAMRLCVSLSRRRRGPAGLRYSVCNLVMLLFFSLCVQYFLNVRGGGWYHYPRSVPHVSETLRGRGLKRQTLPLLGLGRGCSQRTQRAFGTAMRLCASLSRRRRGPAGLRDLFRFCRNCGLYALRSGPFRVCEARGGITTLSALYALLKRWAAACQKGSFAVF